MVDFRKLDPRRLKDALPDISLPRIGRDVDLPVYLIHNSPDPEDYFFIFDFEQFVEQTRAGVFVRPMLEVWAGRDDFGRSAFARQFREAFSREFDAARRQLQDQKERPVGWFGFLWGTLQEVRGATLSAFVANVVLIMATSAGSAILRQILPTGLLSRASDEKKLETKIEEMQGKVDAALVNLRIRLHPELYDHAFRDGGRGPRADLERDAWPLPGYVKSHLNDGTSGAWW